MDALGLLLVSYAVFDGMTHGRFDRTIPIAGSLSALALVAVLVLVALSGWSDAPRFSKIREPLAYALALFVGYVFISASTVGTGFDFGIGKGFVLALGTLQFVRDMRGLRVALASFALAGVAEAGMGMAQFVRVGMPDGGLTGFLANHVQFGLYLGVAIIATLPFVYYADRRWQRAVGAGLLLLEAAVLLATLARGSIIALACAVLVTALLTAGDRRRAVMALAGVGAALAAVGALSGRFARLAEIPSALGDIERLNQLLNSRLQFMLAAWNMFLERPVFGHGYGTFAGRWSDYAPARILNPWTIGVPFAAHSTYLQILAELGVVGLVSYVVPIGMSLTAAIRATVNTRPGRSRACFSAVLCALLVFVLHGTLDNSGWHDRVFWALLALGVVVGRLADEGDTAGVR